MKKKHALIIGGTGGIGRVLVKNWARNKYVLSVINRSLPSGVDRNIQNVFNWKVDLLDHELLSEALTEMIDRNGKINSLVFFQRYRGSGNVWMGELETSLTVTKTVIERLVGEFSNSQEKAIVIVSSLAGKFVAGEQPLSYHVVKSGLNQLVRYYAVALGPKGIRVNCVSPGAVLRGESKKFCLDKVDFLNLYKRITPLGRMGTPKDIANTIDFLCSPKASFVTGQNIVVDGGMSLHLQSSLVHYLASLKTGKMLNHL